MTAATVAVEIREIEMPVERDSSLEVDILQNIPAVA